MLHVQQDMPNVLLRVTQDDFLDSLDTIASNKAVDAAVELADMWDQIKAELHTWMDIKDGKQGKKNLHVHLARAFHALEACSPHGHVAYRQVRSLFDHGSSMKVPCPGSLSV